MATTDVDDMKKLEKETATKEENLSEEKALVNDINSSRSMTEATKQPCGDSNEAFASEEKPRDSSVGAHLGLTQDEQEAQALERKLNGAANNHDDSAELISDFSRSLHQREPNADYTIQKALHTQDLASPTATGVDPELVVDDLGMTIQPMPAPRLVEPSQPGAYPRAGFDASRRQSEGTIHIGVDPEELLEDGDEEQQPQIENNSGLIEAREVNDDLETARPMENKNDNTHLRALERRRTIGGRWLAASCFMTTMVIMLIIALLTTSTSQNDKVTTNTPTATPTTAPIGPPTMAPTPFLVDMPIYSQQSILQNSTSPQALAYQWVRDDPWLDNLTDWRRIQRFALAAFFYSTSGSDWKTRGAANQTFNVTATNIRPASAPPDATNGPPGGGPRPPPPPSGGIGPASEYTLVTAEEWLSYGTNECDWYSDAVLRGVPRCNETGFYRSVTLHGNNLVGTIPPQVGLLSPTLYGFNLRKNPHLTGTIPPEISQLSHVSLLDLGENELSGSLPTELGQLTVRTHAFRFDGNRLTGTIPTEYLQLWNLRELVISNNLVSGTIPEALGESMPNLVRLDLQNNPKMTGTLPTTLGQLSIKRSLRLDGNPYTGSLPTELGNLTNMADFRVNRTQISSTLPSELGQLVRLQILDLSNNPGLSGTIPDEWKGMYTTLEYLNLQSTSISGVLPEEWSLMNETLQYLNIEDTSLQGTIPSNLCNVKTLKFYCEPRKLCGCECACE